MNTVYISTLSGVVCTTCVFVAWRHLDQFHIRLRYVTLRWRELCVPVENVGRRLRRLDESRHKPSSPVSISVEQSVTVICSVRRLLFIELFY